MRCFLLSAALLGLLAGSSGIQANAAVQCKASADQSTYEVLALRQMMVVLATKHCNREDDYNKNFVGRFKASVQANDKAVQSYFRRAYGGSGQTRMDTFTTELVNVLSQQASAQGNDFCGRTGLMVNELLALQSNDELAAYAALKKLPPPGVSMCQAAPARRR